MSYDDIETAKRPCLLRSVCRDVDNDVCRTHECIDPLVKVYSVLIESKRIEDSIGEVRLSVLLHRRVDSITYGSL